MTENQAVTDVTDQQLTKFVNDSVDKLEAAQSGKPRHEHPNYVNNLRNHKVVLRSAIRTVKCSDGHRLDYERLPKHINCDRCWSLFFRIHPGKLMAIQTAIETLSPEQVLAGFDKKMIKHAKKFLSPYKETN